MPRGVPIPDSLAVMVKLPPEIAKAIDDRRRATEDLPSRPEVIRRILAKEFGLEE